MFAKMFSPMTMAEETQIHDNNKVAAIKADVKRNWPGTLAMIDLFKEMKERGEQIVA